MTVNLHQHLLMKKPNLSRLQQMSYMKWMEMVYHLQLRWMGRHSQNYQIRRVQWQDTLRRWNLTQQTRRGYLKWKEVQLTWIFCRNRILQLEEQLLAVQRKVLIAVPSPAPIPAPVEPEP